MKPIYLSVDHHGDYEGVLTELREKKIKNATIIHVGDGEEGYPDWSDSLPEKPNSSFASIDPEYVRSMKSPTTL